MLAFFLVSKFSICALARLLMRVGESPTVWSRSNIFVICDADFLYEAFKK